MKKFNILLGMLFLVLCACSQIEEDTLKSKAVETISSTEFNTHITASQAIQIANNVLSSEKTRSKNIKYNL